MSEPVKVPITKLSHVETVGAWLGAAAVLEQLKSQPENAKLPGFSFALAVVEREVNTLKMDAMNENLRAVARAGYPVHETMRVGLENGPKGMALVVEFLDLADMAEGATDA